MKNKVAFLLGLLLIFWVIGIVNAILQNQLLQYGIMPRTVTGLRGIIFSPFLHHGFSHLMLNSLPFLVLGGLVMLRGAHTFVVISLLITLLSGAGVWVFGRPAYHVGASGLIFGYFGFLLAAGWYERKFSSLLIAVAVLLLYGGLIWGVLPLRTHVSWEGHLFGFIAGVMVMRWR
ncbi:rhomboid family intramembrane serine protease [bacterium]|nr:rhomboid family intramembrane serine protease [bacterium]